MTAACRKTFATSLLVSSPPVPILATFRIDEPLVRITFDQPLMPTSKATLHYFTRWQAFEYETTFASVPAGDPTFLNLAQDLVAGDAGPDVVRYDGGDPTLVGQNGLRVAAFTQPLVSV